jgi:XRE family transcriptional regulator of biofilm formation
MGDEPKDVGQRIKRFRETLGMTLAELARKADISKGYLHSLENQAPANPTLDTLKKVAEALDLTIADLIGAPKVRAVVPEVLPPGLEELVKELRSGGTPLDTETIASLASMRYRGQAPKTKQDFLALLYVLKQATGSNR